MNLIIHHNDDDGRCAAAIAFRELTPDGIAYPSRTIFKEYKHGYTLRPAADNDDEIDIIKDINLIMIVDIAIDEEVIAYLREIQSICDGNLPTIWWIDHHKTSLDFLDECSDEDRAFFDEHIDTFFRVGYSGAMLTWIIAAVPADKRAELLRSDNRDFYEVAADCSAVAVTIDGVRREIGVPMGLRFIDDWDVWRHSMPETKLFNLGFSRENNKHPARDVWSNLLYGDFRWLQINYLQPGELLYNYQSAQNARNMSRAFTATIGGVDNVLCLNNTGNSMVFGDKINEHPAVCLFYYDGVIKKWRYSLYSANESDTDVSEIAKQFGGGGHFHASGFTHDACILK